VKSLPRQQRLPNIVEHVQGSAKTCEGTEAYSGGAAPAGVSLAPPTYVAPERAHQSGIRLCLDAPTSFDESKALTLIEEESYSLSGVSAFETEVGV
jgi:hypothetical protein